MVDGAADFSVGEYKYDLRLDLQSNGHRLRVFWLLRPQHGKALVFEWFAADQPG